MDQQYLKEKLTIFPFFFKIKRENDFLFTNYYRENTSLLPLGHANIRIILIWPLGVLRVCLHWRDTVLFQL